MQCAFGGSYFGRKPGCKALENRSRFLVETDSNKRIRKEKSIFEKAEAFEAGR